LKATYFTEFGGPEVLTYGDVPEPTIGPGEVLVRVHATALNHLDVWRRSGQRGTKSELAEPFILGCDVAGEVAEVAADVSAVKSGDRVVLNPGVTCGTCGYCSSGRDNMCLSYTMIGAAVNGGYAQYVKAPVQNVHRIPDSLEWEEAAAMTLTLLTAYHMLISLAKLRPSETVLIQAVGSGVGSAAVQIAKLVGARAIVTASTETKLERGRELGADETINYEEQDFAKRVKELTEGRGVDVVFDHIGASIFEKNLSSLAKGGRYVNCGITGGHLAQLHIGQLFTKQAQLFGSFMGTKADMLEVMELVRRGKIRGIVDSVFPLERAAEAHRRMEDRNLFGKLVLKVP
jgi:2-desacetyl-2-hydroxyethyl bacteriochlorophyllide A dehydrogenase